MMWRAFLLCICVITGFRSYAVNGIHNKPELFLNKSACLCKNSFGFSKVLILKDTTDKVKREINKRPRHATILSLVLPGLGQAYNRSYWKIPVIYGVAGGLYYLSLGNNKSYKDYKQALISRYDNDTSTEDVYSNYNDETLILQKKKYKKRRDLCYIGIGATYLLNLIDANIDAHLKGFDNKINENLSLSIKPTTNVLMTFQQPIYYSGLKIKLQF